MNSTSRDIPCLDVIMRTLPAFCNNLPIALGSSVLVWLIPTFISGIVFACLVVACIIFGGTAILHLKLDAGSDQIQQVIHALLPVIGIVIGGTALYALTFVTVFQLVSIGWEQILLALAGGERATLSALLNLHANKRWFWKLLVTNILATLAISVGFACFVIPGLFLSARLSLAPFLVIDRDYGPIDALKKSNELVTGYSWQILLLYLLLNCTFLISALFTKLLPVLGPVLLIALIAFYRLVLAKVYLLRADGVELKTPQFTPTSSSQRGAQITTSEETRPERANAMSAKADGLRRWESSSQGNEVTGALYFVAMICILGLGGAFAAGLYFGKSGPATSSGNGSVVTATGSSSTQPGPGAIPASESTPVLVPSGQTTPAQPSDYLSDKVPYSNDQVADNFVRFKADSPLGESNLQLELMAPKDWRGKTIIIQKQEIAKGAGHPLELAEVECDSPNTSLEAWYMWRIASQQDTLDKCFGDYCKSMRFIIVKQNKKPARIEAIVKYSLKDLKVMLARITFIRVGSNIFWLAGCAPESEFGKWSNVFCVAAAGFSPVGYNPVMHPDVVSRTIPGSEVSE